MRLATPVAVPPATALLDASKNSATEMKDSRSQAELPETIEDLRAATEQPNADVGDAMEKGGPAAAIAEKVGIPAVGAAVGGVVGTTPN